MDTSEIALLIKQRNEAARLHMENLAAATTWSKERARLDKLLARMCKHKPVADRDIEGERTVYKCQTCGICM